MDDERRQHEPESDLHAREHHLMAEGPEQELHTEPVAEEVILDVPPRGSKSAPSPRSG